MEHPARTIRATPGRHSAGRSRVDGRGRPWRSAVLFVAPYMLLCLCWVWSNPPAAAPDEVDHLVKAIGTSSGQIGQRAPAAPAGSPLVVERNASITRIFDIPRRLVPVGYTCFAFNPYETAACQPSGQDVDGSGQEEVPATIGAYPPFLYAVIGLPAHLADSPPQAFSAVRLAVVLLFGGLLLLGTSHLVRWLGARALIGYAALLTPSAVFLGGSISTSSVELASAACLGAVIAGGLFERASLRAPLTHATIGVAGVVLVLGRQLGVVFLGVFVLVLLAIAGRDLLKQLVRSRPPFLIAATITGAAACGMVLWWERTFDRPVHLGRPLDPAAVGPFFHELPGVIESSVGTFGWLDTELPVAVTVAWLVVWVALLVAGVVLGGRSVRIVVAVLLATMLVLAFVIYSTGFFPVAASIQGRHVTPVLAPALLVCGAVVARAPQPSWHRVSQRIFVLTAVVAASVSWFALYVNGRRYAVGIGGPWNFVPSAEWSPPGGWVLWLLLAAVGASGVAVGMVNAVRAGSASPVGDGAQAAVAHGLRN